VRIAVVDTYYPAFVAEHYRRRPELRKARYDEQLAALMDRCFGTSDAYSHHLSELGHEAVDLVVNCFELQSAWARECGRRWLLRRAGSLPTRVGLAARSRFLHDVANAQIAEFDPEVVYLQDLWFFRREELDAFRAQGRLVVGQIASAPPALELLRGFDLITTSFPHFVPRFREAEIDCEYFKIGFYERVLDRIRANGVDPSPATERQEAVSFIGGLDPKVHANGTALLERLSEQIPIGVWGYGADGLARDSPIRARYRGEAWGLDMYEVLSRSRISVNRHIDVAEGYANNMRLFETTGVGALLLTEAAPNLADLFEPGREVVTYQSEGDLVEKIEHYLTHDDERLEIAAAGQQRTLAEHTYRRRMTELAAMLEQRVGRPR
jgi:spore maturation protein CgeB